MRRVQSTLFTLFAASSAAFAETTLNLTPGVSPISHDVYELHMTVFWICVVIGILVFGAMFYSIFYHRKSKGAVAAQFHSHFWVEITWTIIPVLILVLMAIPATKVLLNMNNYDQEELTIKITGYQWKWHYDYLEDEVSYFSNLSTPAEQLHNQAPKGLHYLQEVDHPMVVPIHKKIRFLITSNDVNHAWWIPDFGVKRDAVAGFINEAWTIIDKPGTYRGQCAELCGINHAYMPIVVIATTEEGYKDWVAQQKGQATQGAAETNREWKLEELMKQGEQAYNRVCAACHQPTGMGLPPTFPALKNSKIAIGAIEKHIEIVMNGVNGTAMQAFKGQLNDVDLASIITYERNAWGNNTKTFVQPIQIKAYRDGKSIEDALKEVPSTTSAATVAETPAAKAVNANAAAKATDANAPVAMTDKGAPAIPSAVPASTPSATPGVATTPSTTSNTQATLGAPQQGANQASAPSAAEPAAVAAPSAASGAEALKEAMIRGEKIYMNTCAVCHQPSGLGMPPVFPALKDGPIPKGPLLNHLNMVLYGKPGTAMQAFKDQLKDQELADVITYERNAWGNNMGTVVLEADVQSARSKPPQQ